MFERAKVMTESVQSSIPSSAAIAAGVTKTGGHRLAEREMTGLRESHRTARAELLALIAAKGSDGWQDGRINAASAEVKEIEAKINACRRKLAPMRTDHAARVAAALVQAVANDAARILAALALLRGAGARIAEAFDCIASAGGDIGRFDLPVAALGEVEAAARRLGPK